MSDYYNQHVFDTDKHLFVYHQKVWDEFISIYNLLTKCFETSNDQSIIQEIVKHQKQITKLYMMLQDFGHSKSKEFDDFLYNYDHAISAIDDLHLWLENKKLNERARQYQFTSCFERARKYVDIINEIASQWKDKIGVSSEDFASIDLYTRAKPKFQYTQTMPIKPDALEVNFTVNVFALEDKRFRIQGTTNLFDNANIMLSVKRDGKLLGQDKTNVIDQKFSFATFSNRGAGYESGTYKADISLSIPDVQPKEFVKLAGIEYENLCGKYVDRTGVGPTVNYEFEFELK